jgi:hypothetical protein
VDRTGTVRGERSVRHDFLASHPQEDGFAPRLGVAYAPDDKTAIRGGFGKFYEFPSTIVAANLSQGHPVSTVVQFDTQEDSSALRGVRPAHPCLNPVGDGQGRAVISPGCPAQLVATRNHAWWKTKDDPEGSGV